MRASTAGMITHAASQSSVDVPIGWVMMLRIGRGGESVFERSGRRFAVRKTRQNKESSGRCECQRRRAISISGFLGTRGRQRVRSRRRFCLTNAHSQAQYFSILLSKVAIDAVILSPLGSDLLHLSLATDSSLAVLIVSEPRIDSGSGIALP